MAEVRSFLYHAVIGGNDAAPIFCSDVDGHKVHWRTEEASACLALPTVGATGKVYETVDGVFTDTYFVIEQRGIVKGERTELGSPYKGKRRSDL